MNLGHENQLVSEPWILSKTVKLLWGFFSAFVALLLIVSVMRFDHYEKGQKLALDLMAELTDECERGDYSESTVRDVHKYLSPRYGSVYLYGKKYDNSDVIRASNYADESVGNLLSDAGYSCKYGSQYLKYYGFFEYTFATLWGVYVVAVIIGAGLGVFTYIYVKTKDKRLIVTATDMVFEANGAQEVTVPITALKAAKEIPLKGVLVSSEGRQFYVLFVQNGKEIVEALCAKLKSAPAVSYVDETATAAESIQKYKALLDEGVITAQEYDTKKKQLLGL